MKRREPDSDPATSTGHSNPPPDEAKRVLVAVLVLLVTVMPWLLFFSVPLGKHSYYYRVGFPGLALPGIGRAGGSPFLLLWIAFVVVLALLLRVFDRHPRLPVVAAGCAFGITQVVVLFSALYIQAAHDHPTGSSACFALITSGAAGTTGVLHPARVQRWDSLYFTIGTLTTAGTGALQPASQFCRRLVTAQLVVDFVILGVVITTLVSRMAAALDRQASGQA